MEIALQILLMLAGLAALLTGGEILVRAAISLALRFQIRPIVIGLTIVAAGTSAPELFTSVMASLKGASELALGNVVGSNIFNILAVLGLASLINPMHVPRSLMRFEWPLLVFSTMLFVFLVFTQQMNYVGGALCLSLLAISMYVSIKRSNKDLFDPEELSDFNTLKHWLYDLMYLGGAIFLLALGGNLCVHSASNIARFFGVGERIIAVTIVSVGTGLPEMVTSLVAAAKKRHDLAIANVIGSNLLNTLAVAGTAALFANLTIDIQAALIDNIFLAVSTLGFGLAALLGKYTYTRTTGFVFSAVYILYVSLVLFQG